MTHRTWKAAAVVAFAFAWLETGLAGAQTVYVLHRDGRVTTAPAPGESAAIPRPPLDTVLTLDTELIFLDPATGNATNTLFPGKQYRVVAFFDELGTLGVPFEELVGRTLLTFATGAGSFTFPPPPLRAAVFAMPIGAGDSDAFGVFTDVTIPPDAPNGIELVVVAQAITGFNNEDNVDYKIYEVRIPTSPSGGRRR